MISGLHILQFALLYYICGFMIKITQKHMEFKLICITVTRKKALNAFISVFI